MQNVYLNTQTQPAHPQPLLHLRFSSASISFEGQKNALGAEQALNQGMYCRSYFSQTQLKFSQQSSEFKERKEGADLRYFRKRKPQPKASSLSPHENVLQSYSKPTNSNSSSTT